eukprot:g19330.t1
MLKPAKGDCAAASDFKLEELTQDSEQGRGVWTELNGTMAGGRRQRCDINHEDQRWQGWTALFDEAENLHVEVAQWISTP